MPLPPTYLWEGDTARRMTLPARLIQSVRPQAFPGVMAGAAVVAATFGATPFLLPEISARLSIDIGLTGLLSTAQVGSFGLASFFAGRLLRPVAATTTAQSGWWPWRLPLQSWLRPSHSFSALASWQVSVWEPSHGSPGRKPPGFPVGSETWPP